MAVIKIKTIKNNLQAVINYAKNGDKTENGILISGVNCIPESAYEQMALTKKFYRKENNIQGFHIIQSFKGKEVTPEKANQIGKELSEELWGDKYQVVICTHVNKDNVHNHIILNSVSFIDGLKYHNSNSKIAIMKDTSDNLCFKYGLSVIETAPAEKEKIYREKRIDYFNRSDEKMQKIKHDIDKVIKLSKKYSDFKLQLKAKGYDIYDSGMYFTVKSPYYSRKIRLDRAYGKEYSLANIKERIYYKNKENYPIANLKKKYYRKVYTGPKINQYLLKTSSFYRLYVHYLYKFGKLPAKNEYPKSTPSYLNQKKENAQIFEELNFLSKNNFKSIQDLTDYQTLCEYSLSILKGQRENLWKRYHKITDDFQIEKFKQEINMLSQQIKTFYNSINTCTRCINKILSIKENHEMSQKENQKTTELMQEDKKQVRVSN